MLFLPAVGDLGQDLIITRTQEPFHLIDEFVLEVLEDELVRTTVKDRQSVLKHYFEADPFTGV